MWGEFCEDYAPKNEGMKMCNYEIKIRFKSGEVGYFKFKQEIEENLIGEFLDTIKECIKNKVQGTFDLIDMVDDKLTVINISEIATLGYSKLED